LALQLACIVGRLGRWVRLSRVRLVLSWLAPTLKSVSRMGNATRLRRKQTREEAQLWQTLRAGRFAGFKFRRQHPLGGYILDFYCPAARLAVELDGFEHGLPRQQKHDVVREHFLAGEGIEVLRFWNHQRRSNREGVLWEIWHALQRRTGCLQVIRKENNNRFVPPPVEPLGKKPDRKPPRDEQI
jgi:very-short-patch-repair endonuclease